LQHPGGLVLLARDETDRVFRKALRRLVGFDQRLEPITVLVDVDPPDAVDRLLYGWHLFLRSRVQGPRWISSKALLRCFSEEITCLEPFKQCFVATLN